VDNFVDYLSEMFLSPARTRLFPTLPENEAKNKHLTNQHIANNRLTAQGLQPTDAPRCPQGVHDLTYL
jgi:hypothetical protein